ncbi:MAG: BON domain-containing protein [Chloroflexota bacterium]
MAETTQKQARPDIDILSDLPDVIETYPPLAHDRSRMTITVEGGVITATGNVKTAGTRDIFERRAAEIDGVQGVNVRGLHDDDTIRLAAGAATPYGVRVAVSYGAVVLTGERPTDAKLAQMTKKVEKIAGVRKVIPNFREN